MTRPVGDRAFRWIQLSAFKSSTRDSRHCRVQTNHFYYALSQFLTQVIHWLCFAVICYTHKWGLWMTAGVWTSFELLKVGKENMLYLRISNLMTRKQMYWKGKDWKRLLSVQKWIVEAKGNRKRWMWITLWKPIHCIWVFIGSNGRDFWNGQSQR